MDVDDILGCSPRVKLRTKSAIYVWGYNECGQTGRNEKERSLRIPKELPSELFRTRNGISSRWLDIACGRDHTAAVSSDGSLFTWGTAGKLANGCRCCLGEIVKFQAFKKMDVVFSSFFSRDGLLVDYRVRLDGRVSPFSDKLDVL